MRNYISPNVEFVNNLLHNEPFNGFVKQLIKGFLTDYLHTSYCGGRYKESSIISYTIDYDYHFPDLQHDTNDFKRQYFFVELDNGKHIRMSVRNFKKYAKAHSLYSHF